MMTMTMMVMMMTMMKSACLRGRSSQGGALPSALRRSYAGHLLAPSPLSPVLLLLCRCQAFLTLAASRRVCPSTQVRSAPCEQSEGCLLVVLAFDCRSSRRLCDVCVPSIYLAYFGLQHSLTTRRDRRPRGGLARHGGSQDRGSLLPDRRG
jgi:hypothetical protein